MFDYLHAKFTGLIRALVLAFAFMLLIPAVPAQAASGIPGRVTVSGVTTSGSDKVVIRWKKADSATSYRIYYKESGAKKWTTLANVSSKTLTYTHKSSGKYPLKNGKRYFYTVRAYNKYSKKWGSYDTKGKSILIPLTPSAARAVKVKADNYRQVTVTWGKADNATNYLVYYRPASSSKWVKIATVSNKTFKYVHKSSSKYPLKAGQSYYYMVRGYNKTYKTYGRFNKTGVKAVIPNKPQPTKKPTPTPTARPKPTATPKPTETQEQKYARYSKEVIRLINVERKKEGLPALIEHEKLDEAAMIRAKECMVKYAHSRPDGRDMTTVFWDVGAANPIGEILNGAGIPQDVIDVWMASSGHSAVICTPRGTHIGVAYYKDYCVAEFSSGPDSKKTLTIDANGGTFPTKGGVSSYVMELPERMPMRTDEIPIPEKEGFEFQKWTGVYNDGMELNAGEHIALSEDIRLKANWTPISTPSPPPTLTPTLFPESTSTPDEDPVITPEITVTPEPTTAPELAISPSEDFSDASQQDTDLVLDETDTFDDSSEMK